ncbi:Crp/Fnr family transcriptional regulator [Bradyrhizobium sp.]|uniref:Crp/Fnr family transcriptional regulator n=1 Tax=Bradyrhizobium sp. TaxID=376 RepID=UPI004037D7BE
MNNQSPCAACPHHERGFCDAVLGTSGYPRSNPRKEWQYHRVVPAGKQIVARNQSCPDVFVLCVGWGFRFVQLADGRRQILHFLLPGDLFSVSSVFEERPHFSVKALTEVQVSGMHRREVQVRLAQDPAVVAALAETCSTEAESSDEMTVVLGQYSAEERIAFLLLHLMRRLAARNVIRERQYPFPLRQQHIADAVGLTAVHVSRTLGAFRDRGIVEVANGVLTIVDRGELERIGSLN